MATKDEETRRNGREKNQRRFERRRCGKREKRERERNREHEGGISETYGNEAGRSHVKKGVRASETGDPRGGEQARG